MEMPVLKRRSNQKGYTLMEVLIVATIVGILVTVGTVQFLEVKRRSKERLATQKLAQLAAFERLYYRDYGDYADYLELREKGFIADEFLYEDDTILHYERPAYIPEYTLDFTIDNENGGFEIMAKPVLQEAHTWYPRWFIIGGIDELRAVLVREDCVVKWADNGRPVY